MRLESRGVRLLLHAAIALWCIAWLLPAGTYDNGYTSSKSLSGFECAAMVIVGWPFLVLVEVVTVGSLVAAGELFTAVGQLVTAVGQLLSPLANLLVPLTLWGRPAWPALRSPRAYFAAALLALCWLDTDRYDHLSLEVGYWLWLAGFLAIGLALLVQARAEADPTAFEEVWTRIRSDASDSRAAPLFRSK